MVQFDVHQIDLVKIDPKKMALIHHHHQSHDSQVSVKDNSNRGQLVALSSQLLSVWPCLTYIILLRRMSSKQKGNLAQNTPSLMSGQYSLRVLTLEHSKPVLQLLSREFQEQQPMCNAFNKVVPVKDKAERLREWVHFYKLYEKHYLTNGLSIGIFDTLNNDELVGVSIFKDQTYDYQGLEELYMKDVNFMSVYFKVERQLKARVGEKYKSILASKQPGVVLDCYSVAIKKEHSGKHLIQEMRKLLFSLPNLKKYRYLYSFITNPKTAMTFKNSQFETIATVDVKQLQIDGVKYFENIEDKYRYISLFLRPVVLERPSL